MKKILFTLLSLVIVMTSFAQNNSYKDLWQKVEDFEKKSLPKSASLEVDKILKQAIEEKNSPQMIKALIHQGKYDIAIDSENDVKVFDNLNAMLISATNEVEKAVIHSMLASLYKQYYDSDAHNIRARTNLHNDVPEDMKEWTTNIFTTKIVEHSLASLFPQSVLEQTNVTDFEAVIKLGKDSRQFYPSMFDFLARRAQETLRNYGQDLSIVLDKANIDKQSLFAPANEFSKLSIDVDTYPELAPLYVYQKMMLSLEARNMPQSLVMVELDKLDYLSQLQSARKAYAFNLLSDLYEQYKDDGISIEIVNAMSDYYESAEEDIQRFQQNVPRNNPKIADMYNLLQKTIAKFPNHKRIGGLKNRLSGITQAQFTITSNRAFTPNSQKTFNIEYRNLKLLRAKLYKLESPIASYSLNYDEDIKVKKSFVKNIDIPLQSKEPYIFNRDSFLVDIETPGAYRLEFDMDKKMTSAREAHYYFTVTDVASFARATSSSKYEVFVVDRTTGKPKKGAKVNFYQRTNKYSNTQPVLVATVPVNDMGLATYEKESEDSNSSIFYQATVDNDNGMLLTQLGNTIYRPSTPEKDKEVTTRHIFLDRSLYRPGQTVYFKSISAQTQNNKSKVLEGDKVEFSLIDANNQEVSRKTLTTNSFGATSGEFVVPVGLMSGNFSIRTKEGSVYFRVEEYKRPTFEITFDKIDKSYKFDEPVELKGKVESFSGVPIQDAEVSYNITRQKSMWWRWIENSEQYENGAVATDDKGGFVINFTPKSYDEPDNRFLYTFNVEVTVTDINGESQTASYPVRVSNISMHINIEMPSMLEKHSEEKIIIEATNLDGNKINTRGSYKVFSVLKNDSIGQLMYEDVFETGVQQKLKDKLITLPSGKYRLKIQSKDDNNNSVEAEQDVVLFSYADKAPPIETDDWFIIKNKAISPSKPAEVLLGVSSSDVKVLYEVWTNNKLIERKWIDMSKENRMFTFSYSEKYKDGFILLLTYIKNEKFYNQNVSVAPEVEKEELAIKLDVFRDRIQPGDDEEWRVSVVDGNKKPVMAEVLATMYDYSLNSLYPTLPWRLNLPRTLTALFAPHLNRDISFGEISTSGYENVNYISTPYFKFDYFNWFDFSFYHRMRNLYGVSSSLQMRKESISSDISMGAAPNMVQPESVIQEEKAYAADAVELTSETVSEQTPQLRTNFDETAFFYPQLRTNEEGQTIIAFKVPDSNTRWHFRALAHNKEMANAMTEAFSVSQKKLMVTPNLPRFLREGDITSISTKISNVTEEDVEATIEITLFDPTTNKDISDIEIKNKLQQTIVRAEGSTSASWSFTVPYDRDVIGVRIVANSSLYSDGEQHALVILPNRMLVTESMRMDVDKNQTRHFSMDRLVNQSSNSIENYRLTLEFASNPAWFAVQALPLITTPDNDNAVAWFASYYSNILGLHLSNTFPKVKAMVDLWEKQGGDKETLISNLEKNEELKSVLLEETPWVLDAKTETEQKQRLSALFNLNRSTSQSQVAIDKLKELQDASGGWAWMKGLRPNRSITQYILYGMSQLSKLKATTFTKDVQSMQAKAISYIDSEALMQFEQWKKNNKDWQKSKSISNYQLEYLYVRSMYKQYAQNEKVKDMSDFYLSIIKDNWTNFSGLYSRALIAYLMQDNGQTGVAADIIKSFREHATVSDEMGMYWANNREYVFMSQSSISVHHFIMEAFKKVGARDREMDSMKKWLLKQKQTQLWESTHATIDAIYSLLSTGSDWFGDDGGDLTVTIDNKEVKPKDKDLGTGYFKETWSGNEITSQMGNVKVEQNGNTPAWGALYWQYYEDLDKIEDNSTELDVKKELYKEEVGESGKQLIRVTDNNALKVGDRVVIRLTVRTDRNFEFVHLKDMRAAALEPVSQISRTQWQNGVLYYQASKDASTNFYFDVLPRGTYVFEYSVFVNRIGEYSNGISSIQCMYAPEFISHTKGIRINVKE